MYNWVIALIVVNIGLSLFLAALIITNGFLLRKLYRERRETWRLREQLQADLRAVGRPLTSTVLVP